MRNAGLRLAVLVCLGFAMFGAFMVTSALDEAGPQGATEVTVSGPTVTTGSVGLPALVDAVARDSGANVVREVADLRDPSRRHLYLAVGDVHAPGARWVDDGYPWFSRAVSTEVHPVAELEGHDPRGRYYVYGDADDVESLVRAFTELRYDVDTTSRRAPVAAVVDWFVAGPVGSATLVVALLVVLLVSGGVMSGTKAYAVQRLHGGELRTAIGRDVRSLALFTAAALLVVSGAAVVALQAYNGLHQVGRFAQAAGTVFVAMLLLAAVVYAATLRLVWGTRLLDAIKGRLGFRVAAPVAYLVRVPGLVLAVVIVGSLFSAIGAADTAADARRALDGAGDAATIHFDGLAAPEEQDRLAAATGAWLKREDSAGRALLAVPTALADPDATRPDSLFVNNAYLARNPMVDDEGREVTRAPDGTVLVLLPDDQDVSHQEVRTWLGAWAAMNPGHTDRIEFRSVAAGQSHFLYQAEPDDLRSPLHLDDVMVVVANPDTGMISDDDYMAYASQGRVLMTDMDDAIARTPAELMGVFVAAYVPVAQAAADFYASQVELARIQLVSLVVALVVLLTTAVGLAQIHVRANASEILVRYLHGWTFVGTHRRLLVAEAVTAVGALVWAVGNLVALAGALNSSDIHEPLVRGADLVAAQWQPWAVALVALTNLVFLVLAVRGRVRNLVRNLSEESV
ncbi:hypothetical protein [Promicromonospora sp. NPDC057488]|uniref:hypothetical protein n=1 Tax=Promicromonospora sp. NPDC057488 TaxID=3346147 RepID=UPI0036705868